ncbi:M48 family peptidase [Brasilonema octagenarum UFV-E1]|uniref:M48 family peptidase n=2 Tax=Bromeliae group (in: Brasilonema) TaxID=3398495 RepID=A0A856MIM5_9CYAN|nr:M48 family peptidase [Brasilonema sennae CENA114]QDL15183.1 M48 family peptidase [Brasilonema octagenarum UFV-E1]
MQMQTIHLKNIKTQQRAVLDRISNLASTATPNTIQIQELTQTITQVVATIEKICAQSQATPANLTRCSRHIYAWMKFLTHESNLQLHLQTTYKIKQIAQTLCETHQQQLVNIVVELTQIAGLCKYKRSLVGMTIILSEGFINASDEILEALVKLALFGKCQHSTRLIRNYAESEEYSYVLTELDVITEVVVENAKGNYYDLNELFHKVNHEYFASSLIKPRLIWGRINTYRKFGHYESARDKVMIALTLDNASIPEFVVEFVLYHELLHKYHGATWINGRRMVHTTEFRRDERKFKLYKEAEEWLNNLSSCDKNPIPSL